MKALLVIAAAHRLSRSAARASTPAPPVDKPDRYNLRLGTMRQRHELRPQVQIWCRSALGWVMDLGSVKQVPRQP